MWWPAEAHGNEMVGQYSSKAELADTGYDVLQDCNRRRGNKANVLCLVWSV
jgi:hypothetical protein